MLRSSNAVNKGASVVTRCRGRTLLNPGFGAMVELLSSETRGPFNFQVIDKGLTGERFAAEQAVGDT